MNPTGIRVFARCADQLLGREIVRANVEENPGEAEKSRRLQAAQLHYGLTSDEQELLASLTAAENVMLPLELSGTADAAGRGRRAANETATSILEILGDDRRLELRPDLLPLRMLDANHRAATFIEGRCSARWWRWQSPFHAPRPNPPHSRRTGTRNAWSC